MFVDIHVHTNASPIPLPRGSCNWATPDYLLTRYDALNIDAGVLLPTVNPECATQIQSIEEALAIANRHPGRLIPFSNIDPRMENNDGSSDLGAYLAYYRSLGCRGCGEVCANLSFDDPRVERLFHGCEENELPLTFHVAPRFGGCYGLYDEPGLPLLERALQRFPGLIFLGHSQPFWAEIGTLASPDERNGYPQGAVQPGRVVALLRAYPNLHGDLSANSGFNAISRDESFGVDFLEEFQQRLYFGTDICHPDTPTPLVDYLLRLRTEKKISEMCFQNIARENAVRLLRLTDGEN